MEKLKQKLFVALEAELSAASELRWKVHQDPRISGEESDTLAAFEEHIGFQVTPTAETGGFCRLGPDYGPAIAIRGELDALPIVEETGVAKVSKNGAMHACGHDIHLAALAAVVRAARQVELPVALIPVLQPREETYPSGALDIKNSGLLEKEKVAYAIGAHVHPGIPKGEVALGSGVVNAAAGELHIEIVGSGGHGAYPHQAQDVVATVAAIATGIHEIVRRNVNPMHPALVSVGQMIADSGAPNVLPATGKIAATIRTTGSEDASYVVAALDKYCSSVATAYGVSANLTYVEGEPVLDNDPTLCEEMKQELKPCGISIGEPMRSLGADDFSFFSSVVPSVMAFVGVENQVSAEGVSLHDPRFLPDEDAVRRVALTMMAGYLAGVKLLQID